MSNNETAAISAEEALKILAKGNRRYIRAVRDSGDVSKELRLKTTAEGQRPYAVIIACSDSRVIPESIFRTGIGELFVIRVAGNVMDKHQLGSVEYAVSHLGCKLVAVLGHTHCGAVGAALGHEPDGYVKYITDEILKAAGSERSEDRVCRLNVQRSVSRIEKNLDMKKWKAQGVKVVGAMYDIETGKVEFGL